MADGQQSDSGQGSLSVGNFSVRLRSRKSPSAGTASQPLMGQGANFAQGEFAKTRTKPLTGSAIASGRGNVTAPEPPSPPLSADSVLFGSAIVSQQWRVGPGDRANLSELEDAIEDTPAWTTFWGDSLERISPSRNGVRATNFVKLPVWGLMNLIYNGTPELVDGMCFTRYHNQSSIPDAFMPFLETYGARGGARGAHLTSAYTTYHGHSRIRVEGIHSNPGTWSMSPHIPQWIGVQMDGQFVFLMRNGSVTMPFKIPAVVAGIAIENIHDFAFNPPPNNIKIMYAVDTENGRVLKIDRTPAFTDPGNPNFEDFTLWAVTVFATGLTRPTSLRVTSDGTLYVADHGAGSIVKITAAGLKSTLLTGIPDIFWIDTTSTDQLVIGTLQLGVYIVNPLAPSLSNVINTPNGSDRPWLTVSVDREGTWGPVDEFTVIAIGGSGNIDLWRYQDSLFQYQPIPQGFGILQSGNTQNCQDFVGHYVWVAEHHPDEAIMLVQGLSNMHPSLLACRPTGYPTEDAYDHASATRGREVIKWGAGEGVLHDTYPTFTCQMSLNCGSLIGCTADYLAQKSFAELAAFIQDGMFGSFPRPEIKGRDLYAMMYLIYRSSQRFLNEGNTLMSQLRSFCLPTFGQEPAPVTQDPPNSETNIHMRVLVEGPNLRVRFQDKYEAGATPEAGLIVRILVDEGFSQEVDLGNLGTPWITPVPTLTAGQHSLRALPVSGVSYLGKYRGQATAHRAVPAWRQGLPINQWVKLTGSAMVNFPPSVNPGGTFSNVANKLNAWNCLSIDTRTSTIWSVANGGRTDYYGNEVMKMSLTDSPEWVEMLPANSLAEFTIPNNSGYYSNGRRCSDHGFYSKVFIERRNRAMCFGAVGITTTDNSFANVDGFDSTVAPGVNGWDAPGSYNSIPGVGFATGWATSKNPSTEDVYVAGAASLGIMKWTEASGAWSTVSAALPMAFDQAASAFDSTRGRIFYLVGMVNGVVIPVCHTYDVATQAITARTLTGAAAARANSQLTTDHGRGMVYVPDIDAYIVRLKETTVLAGGTIVKIDASTFEATFLTTGGGALIPPSISGTAQNPWGKLLYAPELQGVVFVPNYNSDAWFLRLY
jgi:hypothetical protein